MPQEHFQSGQTTFVIRQREEVFFWVLGAVSVSLFCMVLFVLLERGVAWYLAMAPLAASLLFGFHQYSKVVRITYNAEGDVIISQSSFTGTIQHSLRVRDIKEYYYGGNGEGMTIAHSAGNCHISLSLDLCVKISSLLRKMSVGPLKKP